MGCKEVFIQDKMNNINAIHLLSLLTSKISKTNLRLGKKNLPSYINK